MPIALGSLFTYSFSFSKVIFHVTNYGLTVFCLFQTQVLFLHCIKWLFLLISYSKGINYKSSKRRKY